VAIDYARAMAAHKVGAEGGHVLCQWQVGFMYCNGLGVDVDYAQALPWIEKAAAQNEPSAVGQLGVMYSEGKGVTPSWRRAREYYKRAIELGSSMAVKNMQDLTQSIQLVAPLMDKRVEIHGASGADLDGKCGIATDFHYYKDEESKWFYTVKLDGGEEFKVKRASVRAEGPGPEKLFELGHQVWTKMSKAARIGGEGDGARWRELSASEQGEMDGAIVMLQEAMNLVSEGGACLLVFPV